MILVARLGHQEKKLVWSPALPDINFDFFFQVQSLEVKKKEKKRKRGSYFST